MEKVQRLDEDTLLNALKLSYENRGLRTAIVFDYVKNAVDLAHEFCVSSLEYAEGIEAVRRTSGGGFISFRNGSHIQILSKDELCDRKYHRILLDSRSFSKLEDQVNLFNRFLTPYMDFPELFTKSYLDIMYQDDGEEHNDALDEYLDSFKIIHEDQ